MEHFTMHNVITYTCFCKNLQKRRKKIITYNKQLLIYNKVIHINPQVNESTVQLISFSLKNLSTSYICEIDYQMLI